MSFLLSFVRGALIALFGVLTREYIRRATRLRLFGFMTLPVGTAIAASVVVVMFPSGYLFIDILTVVVHILIFMLYDYALLKWLKDKNK